LYNISGRREGATAVAMFIREALIAIAVAILLALTVPASAEDLNSANYMLPGCKGILDPESTATWRQGRCAGFIDGLVHGVRGKDFCLPKGVTSGQGVAVVVKYIEARPERMHKSFGLLALEALMAAWPCKR
jgi:Ssp1 endopeptidase immunity protein Rap1a